LLKTKSGSRKMMNRDDRDAIEGLFDRLAAAARQSPHRDPDAEALINAEMARQPVAAYYMAQTIVVQQQALEAAARRIEELEAAERRGRNGLFGGLFDDGHGRQNRDENREEARNVVRQRGPWDRGAGGGFLAGAAQTALGVAGGVMLGSAIGSLLDAGSATAAEPDAGQGADTGSESGGSEDADFGDSDFGGDGFDIGGDF
jgi:uncharacterized protein